MLAELVKSKSRAEILRLLFDGQEREMYLRSIVSESSVRPKVH